MSIKPLYKCPVCKERGFAVNASNEKTGELYGVCLACKASAALKPARGWRKPKGEQMASKVSSLDEFRVEIVLSEMEYQGLDKLAAREYRTPEQQVAFELRQAMEAKKVVPPREAKERKPTTKPKHEFLSYDRQGKLEADLTEEIGRLISEAAESYPLNEVQPPEAVIYAAARAAAQVLIAFECGYQMERIK